MVGWGTRTMERILRGEIRWANLDPVQGSEQGGRRPVLILSENVFNERSGTVIAMALTSQEPKVGFPFTVELQDAGLPSRSWVKISQIRTLSAQRLGAKLGTASEGDIAKILAGLNRLLDS